MKAIIMAGGEGSRLRPLTCDLPKPMVRLCGRPILEYILDLLELHGVSEAGVTLRYLGERVTEHFYNQRYGNITLDFVGEDIPLGTAGGVKNAAGSEEHVLVISGDAMCDFDLSVAMDFHLSSGADATILAKRVHDPREYGLIDTREGNRVSAFIEKPAYSQAISDLANTGIYILSRTALDMIPAGVSYDFAKDLFPQMLRRGMKLLCMEDGGYWCDIGDLSSYVACQRDMLAGRVNCRILGERDAAGNIFAGRVPVSIQLRGPVYVGRNVSLDPEARIEPYSVLDDGCTVGKKARVSGSVLLPNSLIGSRATLTGAIVCAGAAIKDGAMLFEGATVGSGAVIGRDAAVHPGVKVWPRKTVPAGAVVSEHVKTSPASQQRFYDDGMAGEIGVELTPEYMARLGAAVGSYCSLGSRVAAGHSGDGGADLLYEALISGIRSTGAAVMDYGEMFRSQFAFAMSFHAMPLGVYVHGGARASVQLLALGGLPATRDSERSVEILFSRGEFRRSRWNDMGERIPLFGMDALYRSQLLRCAPRGLDRCAARVRSGNPRVKAILGDALAHLGCDMERGFVLEVSSAGDKVRVRDDAAGYVPHHKILAWCAARELERGEDVALPFDAPRLTDEIAQRHGCRVLRYYNCPADQSDAQARALAAGQGWVRDGLLQSVMLMDMVRQTGGIEQLAGRYPGFEVHSLTIETEGNPAGLLRRMNTQRTDTISEGVVLRQKSGVVLIRPLKQGGGLRILAEAASAETAEELCADIEKQLRPARRKEGGK